MNLPNFKEAKKREKRDYKTTNYKIDDTIRGKYSGKKYYLKTYGCQMNEHDSENIEAMLNDLGFVKVDDYLDCDLCILNTCSIRENAHNKAFGMLGRLKHLKNEKKDLIIGLCGCMAQEESVVEEIMKDYKFVNFVFGTHNLDRLPEILDVAVESNKQQIEVLEKEGDLVEGIPVLRTNSYKAYVNIIYGCDKFCTYCIVPYTRGSERSRKKEDIIREVEKLKTDGYKEVTLLGQNVNAYGKDLDIDYDMSNLLSDVSKTGIDRIRFVTSHPWDFTDEMIDVIAKYNNIMPYIHLPLQSGSDRILKLMGRKYTKDSYLELFHKIKNKVENVSITTDIIVGFPGETIEDFNDTLDVVNECKYDSAFTFIFSPREGTPASKMKDDLPLKEKEERLYKLNNLINKYAKEANDRYLGKTVKVLLEGKSSKDCATLMGYTDTMKLVNVDAPLDKIGEIVDVKITNVQSFSMDGKIVE